MKQFDAFLKNMDLDYLSQGKYKISFPEYIELKNNDNAILLDVRTHEENAWVSFNFAKHIPLNELPDRIAELPKDKIIAIFCCTATRATIAYSYLSILGYDARILPEHIGDLASHIKAGFVAKNPLS
ncbi:rhodanese-like domain-containing protein [Clostridia bacterium]|nr:rhodanese-like domain-containing protein [Clostridia bacterium]